MLVVHPDILGHVLINQCLIIDFNIYDFFSRILSWAQFLDHIAHSMPNPADQYLF